jgi:hypothetical protein
MLCVVWGSRLKGYNVARFVDNKVIRVGNLYIVITEGLPSADHRAGGVTNVDLATLVSASLSRSYFIPSIIQQAHRLIKLKISL